MLEIIQNSKGKGAKIYLPPFTIALKPLWIMKPHNATGIRAKCSNRTSTHSQQPLQQNGLHHRFAELSQ